MEKSRKGASLLAMPVAQCGLYVRRFARPIALVCVLFYLGFHTFHGERGLYALFREQQELQTLKEELTKTKAKREHLEARVTRLRDGSIDLDLLDEQMRRMLGVSRPGEVMLIQ